MQLNLTKYHGCGNDFLILPESAAQGLKLKKVPSAVYAGLLDELDEEEYLDGLRTLLAAKRKHVKARTDYERNGKLIRFALGRGYEMDAIRRCLPEADDDEFMD